MDEWRKKSPEKERMIRVIKENLQRESPRTRENQKVGSNQQLQMWVCGEDAQYDK